MPRPLSLPRPQPRPPLSAPEPRITFLATAQTYAEIDLSPVGPQPQYPQLSHHPITENNLCFEFDQICMRPMDQWRRGH